MPPRLLSQPFHHTKQSARAAQPRHGGRPQKKKTSKSTDLPSSRPRCLRGSSKRSKGLGSFSSHMDEVTARRVTAKLQGQMHCKRQHQQSPDTHSQSTAAVCQAAIPLKSTRAILEDTLGSLGSKRPESHSVKANATENKSKASQWDALLDMQVSCTRERPGKQFKNLCSTWAASDYFRSFVVFSPARNTMHADSITSCSNTPSVRRRLAETRPCSNFGGLLSKATKENDIIKTPAAKGNAVPGLTSLGSVHKA
jgi:hypothetical protein